MENRKPEFWDVYVTEYEKWRKPGNPLVLDFNNEDCLEDYKGWVLAGKPINWDF